MRDRRAQGMRQEDGLVGKIIVIWLALLVVLGLAAFDTAQILLARYKVADAAQETVTERLWQAWPVCAEHDLGMHPRDADGQLSWWCAGERLRRGPAQVRAAVGALDTFVRPRRPNRKRRRAS